MQQAERPVQKQVDITRWEFNLADIFHADVFDSRGACIRHSNPSRILNGLGSNIGCVNGDQAWIRCWLGCVGKDFASELTELSGRRAEWENTSLWRRYIQYMDQPRLTRST